MVETNIKMKVEDNFFVGINVVKEIEGDNDDVQNEKSSSACGKDRYEERTDGNKEIEQANTEIAVYEDIPFWSRTYFGKFLVSLKKIFWKLFGPKDEQFAPTVRPGKIVRE